MNTWKMLSIKHTGKLGKRGTERQEPYYLARNRCEVSFDVSNIVIGKRALLFYSPVEEYGGNGILTSPVVSIDFLVEDGILILETENSIYEMALI